MDSVPGLTRLSARDLGISFTNRLADARSITNRNLLSGSGVAIGDVDGDGLPDLFLVGLDTPPALYRNLGSWRFTDISETALAGTNWRNPFSGSFDLTGTTMADLDGDGDLDLLVNALGGGTRFFGNDGAGRFTEQTDVAGLRSQTGAMSLTLADIDGDGDLDLYVARFRPVTVLDQPNTKYQLRQTPEGPVIVSVNGRPATAPDLVHRFELGPSGDIVELGEVDSLFLNEGAGHFTEVPWTSGAFLDEAGLTLKTPPRDWGLAARFHDLNTDGRPDLYVCNDLQTPDRVWINETARGGPIRFRALSPLALRTNPTFSMGVEFADFDRNGFVDIFVVDMFSRNRAWRQTQMAGASPTVRLPGNFYDRAQVQRNSLQMNRGDGTWADTAWQAGVAASEWSWGPLAVDIDLDGFEDILVPNGQWRDFQDADAGVRLAKAQPKGGSSTAARIAELVRTLPKLATPNVAFRNRGDATFEDVSVAWGFNTGSISQGAALADLDGDGDIDVVMNDLMDAPAIYRNNAVAGRVSVRLRGRRPNTRGIGAHLSIRAGELPVQTQEMIAGGRYLSGDEAVRTFATGKAKTVDVEVHWRSGVVDRFPNIPADTAVEITEGDTEALSKLPSPRVAYFESVSSRLNHKHFDEYFDDFSRQPLLPERLSQLGPGVTWTDLNGDDRSDLVIGAGRGGKLSVYLNRGDGNFDLQDRPPFQKPTGRDLTTLLPLSGAIIAGVSNYEDGLTNGGALRLYDPASGRSGEMLIGLPFSTGPLAAADVDGDGLLEVFVGGRVRSGQYPEPVQSLLLRNEGGRFIPITRWEGLGLISSACFTDLDADGCPDLVVVGEWGKPHFFHNQAGQLLAWKPSFKSFSGGGLYGAWNSITAGDFDEDGRMDLVLGNSGNNRRHTASSQAPRRLWYGELGSGNGNDLVETWFDPSGKKDRAERDYLMLGMLYPSLRDRASSYSAYSTATFQDLWAGTMETAAKLEINTFESVVLLNRGAGFEVRILPAAMNQSPAFGLCVADYDGDGHEDVFVAQNSSTAQPFGERTDAGRGIWLRGDGRGSFTADLNSGVSVSGDGRGAAVADYDADGRIDLVVTQNGADTTLWRNVTAKPGVRIRLKGALGNPSAIGASMRLVYSAKAGPWREIHLGSGYWSCDDPIAVLGKSGEPTGVEVRWPGGRVSTQPIKLGQSEVQISISSL